MTQVYTHPDGRKDIVMVDVWTCSWCGYQTNLKGDRRAHRCDPKRVEDHKASKEREGARVRSTVKVTFSDGDHLTTWINTDLEGAKAYYLGQTFDHYPDGPDGREVLRKAVKVELEE